MEIYSSPFVVSSQFKTALDEIRPADGRRFKVILQRKIGKDGEWRGNEPTSLVAAKAIVKGLDGAPVPGSFRLKLVTKEEDHGR